MIYCKKCGRKLADSYDYCPNCGWKVEHNVPDDEAQGQTKAAPPGSQETGQTAAGSGTMQYPQPLKPAENEAKKTEQSEQGLSRRFKYLMLGILAIALVVIIVFAVRTASPVKIDLADYTDLSYDGEYSGYTSVSLTVNYDKLMQDVASGLRRKGKISRDSYHILDGQKYEDVLNSNSVDEGVREVVAILSGLDFSLDKTENVVNGDTITQTCTYDASLLADTRIELESLTLTYTISGLRNVTSFDPFANVVIEFEGYDGEGTARAVRVYSTGETEVPESESETQDTGGTAQTEDAAISETQKQGEAVQAAAADETQTGSAETETGAGFRMPETSSETAGDDGLARDSTLDAAISHLEYRIDKASGLKNGDTVTVTVVPSGMEEGSQEDIFSEFIRSYGMAPETTQKEYTVSGLRNPVTDFTSLTDYNVGTLKTKASELLQNYAYDNAASYKFQSLEYVGQYMVTFPAGSKQKGSIVGLVYKQSVTGENGGQQKTEDRYFAAVFDEVSTDGTEVYYENTELLTGDVSAQETEAETSSSSSSEETTVSLPGYASAKAVITAANDACKEAYGAKGYTMTSDIQ